MKESEPSIQRAFGFAGTARLMALRLSLCILLVRAFVGQDRVSPSISLGPPLMSVASNVGKACGNAIQLAVIQHDAEARLRRVGVTVSNIYNAELAIDVDCVAIRPSSRGGGLAVHQCLSFFQTVDAASNDDTVTLATTWRKCQSQTCGGPRCESLVRSGLDALITTLRNDFQDRKSQYLVQIVQNRAQPQKNLIPEEEGQRSNGGFRITGRVAVYGLYIMNCLIVLLYWQFRKIERSVLEMGVSPEATTE